jgi:hypothetical protein
MFLDQPTSDKCSPTNTGEGVEMEGAFRNASQVIANNRFMYETIRPDGVTVSVGPRSLETFVDLGLSDFQIARYFGTSENRVVSLRRYYGLAEATQ